MDVIPTIHMAFSFNITSERNDSRQIILHLCEKYNPGYTVVRNEVRQRNDRVVYTVDVYDPTPYGMELYESLRKGRHLRHGPVWCIDYPSPHHGAWRLSIR